MHPREPLSLKAVRSYKAVQDALKAGGETLLDAAESPLEMLLMAACIIHGLKDRMQCQVDIGPYRADFVFDGWLVVEADGWEFHYLNEHQIQANQRRDRRLVREGYAVARFPGFDVWRELDDCVAEIEAMLEARVHRAHAAYLERTGGASARKATA